MTKITISDTFNSRIRMLKSTMGKDDVLNNIQGAITRGKEVIVIPDKKNGYHIIPVNFFTDFVTTIENV